MNKDKCKCGRKPEELTKVQEEHCFTKLVCRSCKDYWIVKRGIPKYGGNLLSDIMRGFGPKI
jgi:hypothetical protein